MRLRTDYRMRCGEEVPLGVECAFPPPAGAVPMGHRVRRLAWLAGTALRALARWRPLLRHLPDYGAVSGDAPTASRWNVRGPDPRPT